MLEEKFTVKREEKKKSWELQDCGSMTGNECSVVNFRVTRDFAVSL